MSDFSVKRIADASGSVINPATEETLQSVRKHTRNVDAYYYDFAIRRSGGRLLANVDWLINTDKFGLTEQDIDIVRVEGASSYSIVKIADEGIPSPEADGSPYVLKVVIDAGSTAYIRVPVRASAFSVFVAYTAVYPKDYDVEFRMFITLGGNITAYRNRPPKRFTAPANTWARAVTHWFMELHHGASEIDLEIYNPQAVSVTVYVGIVIAGEIKEAVKAHGMLLGFEGEFYIPLNAETFDWSIDVMLPLSFADCAHMGVFVGIQSLDGTSVSADIYVNGVLIASGSTTNSTTVSTTFKYLLKRSGVYGFPTMTIRIVVNASGSAKINQLSVVFYGFSGEFRYQKFFPTTVSAGATTTLADYSSDTKHIAGGKIKVAAPSDGDVVLLASSPEGEIEIARVDAGTTEEVTIHGRYLYIKAVNKSTTTDATLRVTLYLSDAFLPR